MARSPTKKIASQVLALVVLGTAAACATSSQPADSEAPKAGSIPMDSLASEDGAPNSRVERAAVKSSSPKSGYRPQYRRARVRCRKLWNGPVQRYRELSQKLDPSDPSPVPSPLKKALTVGRKACRQHGTRRPALRSFAKLLRGHTGRLGLILPLSGKSRDAAIQIKKGLATALEEQGFDPEKKLLVRNGGGNEKATHAALAELVLKRRVSLVVGGLTQDTAELLAQTSQKLRLPTALLSSRDDSSATSPYSFQVYPNRTDLANSLAAAARETGIEKVAIFRPNVISAEKAANYFREALGAAGGKVVTEVLYTPGDFESMKNAGRKLFRLEKNERRDEYRRKFERAKRKAREKGVPFNPDMVSLEPIVRVDAVYLPTNFREARHTAKLFRFFGVKDIRLLGNHAWRSSALLDPYDEFFDGALFADFIGRYDTFPQKVAEPSATSPYFAPADEVDALDFRIIGYRVGRVAAMTLQNPRVRRSRIADAMPYLRSDSEAFFGTGQVFGEDRKARWPTYVFQVNDGRIQRVDDERSARTTVINRGSTGPTRPQDLRSRRGRRRISQRIR